MHTDSCQELCPGHLYLTSWVLGSQLPRHSEAERSRLCAFPAFLLVSVTFQWQLTVCAFIRIDIVNIISGNFVYSCERLHVRLG